MMLYHIQIFLVKNFIYGKSGAQEEYSVFLTNIVGDAICEEKCILKCYDYYIAATDAFIYSYFCF